MYYLIDKKDLNDLFSEYKINLEVDKKNIIEQIENSNIFPNEEDDLKTIEEKKIAYLVSNHEEILIELNNGINNINESHLIAALMSDTEKLTIKIVDNSYLNLVKNKYTLIETPFYQVKMQPIDPLFLLSLTEIGWDSNDFIFKKIKEWDSNISHNTQLIMELVSYTPSEKWLDNNFLEEFFKMKKIDNFFTQAENSLKHKTLDILYNKEVLDKIIEIKNSNLLSCYLERLSEYNKDDSLYSNYNKKTIKNDPQKDLYPDLLKKEQVIISELNNYLNDSKFILNIIPWLKFEDYQYINENVKKDNEVKDKYLSFTLQHFEKKCYQNSHYIYNFTNVIGLEHFADNRVQDFLLKNAKHIYDKSYKPLLIAEIFKKSDFEIINILSNNSGLDYFWDYLSLEQKQDEKMVKACLKQNPKLYHKLNEKLRLNKEIFKLYYTGLAKDDIHNKRYKEFKTGKIEIGFFESFNDEEMIDLITVLPIFVNDKKFPLKFFDNEIVMSYTTKDYQLFQQLLKNNESYKVTMNKVFNNKSLALITLKNSHYIYENLSENIKNDIEIINCYIDNSYNLNTLPPKTFLNKNTMIKLLSKSYSLANKIPKEYLNDQDFILKIFKKIDSGEVNEGVTNILPTVINEILNQNKENLKKGDYFTYFSNAFSHMNLQKNLNYISKTKEKKNKI